MEVIRGWTHRPFPITDPSCVGEVRRHASRLVSEWGWSEVDVGRLCIVVNELGTNLLRHARDGELWVAAVHGRRQVELIALDRGPGIVDVARSSEDGVSSASGSPGTGLGAIRRLACVFDIHSSPEGTICLARIGSDMSTADRSSRRLGAVSIPAPRESVCGDGWAAAFGDGRLSLAIADGLGHGPDAAVAADAALRAFEQGPFMPLETLLPQVHTASQTSRGSAFFAMHVDTRSELTYAGAGNILGRVFSGVFDQSMVTQPGTMGVQFRKPAIARMEMPMYSVAIIHSDGVASRWKSGELVPLLQKDPALIAAALLWRHSRKRDDATVVVLKQGGGA